MTISLTARHRLMLLGATASLALSADLAHAQTASAPAAQPAEEAAGGSDIIVTALRREQRLEDVPAAVVAVSGEALATAGVTRFQDIAIVAPGVQIARSGTYTQPVIRGVSTTFAGNGQETNVAVYIDGFYMSDQISINQDFANIQDVQVLKGPQGTLYGRNATGGAILITTRGPTKTLTAEASASYAPRFNDRKFSAFVAGPLTDWMRFSVAGYYRQSDGYFEDINNFAPNVPLDPTTYTFGGRYTWKQADDIKRGGKYPGRFKNYSIRPKLQIDLGPDVEVTLGYVHNFVDDPRAQAYTPTAQLGNPAPLYNGYPVSLNVRDRTSLSQQPINQAKIDEFNGTIKVALGDYGTLVSRSAYRKQADYNVYDLDGTPAMPGIANTSQTPPAAAVSAAAANTYLGIQHNRRKTFTQQLDYSGDFGNLGILAGFFYYDDKFSTPIAIEDLGLRAGFPAANLLPNPTLSITNFDTKAWAVYLDATYNIGDKLFITAGGRYANDRKRLSRFRYSYGGGPSVGGVNTGAVLVPRESSICYTGGPNTVLDLTCSQPAVKGIENDSFTPHVVLRYNIDSGTNIYASVSRGFKAGTMNSAPPFNSLTPETVTAYEAGIKTAQGGFRGELSGFFYNYKNNQISAVNTALAGTTTLIVNSGGSRTYGLDGSVSYRFPSVPLNLRASLSYLHARYTDFDNAPNVTVTPADRNTTVIGSWTGRRVARAPDWSGSVSADYTIENVLGGKLMLSGTMTFSSRYAPQNASYQCAFTDIDPGPAVVNRCTTDGKGQPGRLEEDGYVLGNARISWTDRSDRFTLTVFGDNITNTRYKIISSALSYFTYDMYNEPSTFGAQIGVKF